TETEGDDATGVLMPGDHRAFDESLRRFGAPVDGRPFVGLDVRGADTAGADFDDDLAGTRFGDRQLLDPVVVRSVGDDCLHRLGHRGTPFLMLARRLSDCYKE